MDKSNSSKYREFYEHGSNESSDESQRRYAAQLAKMRDSNIPASDRKDTVKAATKNTHKGYGSHDLSFIYFPCFFIYLEIVFHVFVYGFNFTYLPIYVFSTLIYSLFFLFITGLYKPGANYVISIILSAVLIIWFTAQSVYYTVFTTFLSVYSIGENGADVTEFWKDALDGLGKSIVPVLLYILPLILMIILKKKGIFKFKHRRALACVLVFISILPAYLALFLTLKFYGTSSHSPYDIYYKNFVFDLSVNKLGVTASAQKDIAMCIFPDSGTGDDIEFVSLATPTPELTQASTLLTVPDNTSDYVTSTPAVTSAPTPTPVDKSPNVLDIDFAALAGNDTNDTIAAIDKYMSESTATSKNKYTGIFSGYNLIMLTAESYSYWAVNEDLTPTLYKMVHDGFYFEHYYTPLWWTSTSDGEFVDCTGLIPNGTNSFHKTAKNAMPFCLGWQFLTLGYNKVLAFHDHTYTYYHRDETHPNMGYDYKGVGNGLDMTKTWPESDVEMMEKTIPEYINDSPFHIYYMTVSGHMEYNFSGNYMASKNKDYVKDLDLPTGAKAYLACQIELDKAMEYLLNELEKAGVADKTVIVLSGDHYPYGLDKSDIDALNGSSVEENFELYKSHLILYCPGTKGETVSKYCSSLDILPTIYNMFGLDYDSRLFLGQDIFSDNTPLVMFSNQSFITDKAMYNSQTGEVTSLNGSDISDDYIDTVSKIVKNKFKISGLIVSSDYYRHLMPYLNPKLEDLTGY